MKVVKIILMIFGVVFLLALMIIIFVPDEEEYTEEPTPVENYDGGYDEGGYNEGGYDDGGYTEDDGNNCVTPIEEPVTPQAPPASIPDATLAPPASCTTE